MTPFYFSCGSTIEDWTEEDDPSSIDFHQPTCEFYTGVAFRNRPIGTSFRIIFVFSLVFFLFILR